MLQLKVMILFLSSIASNNILVVLNLKVWRLKEKLGLRRVQTCGFIEFQWLTGRTILFIQPNLENDFAIGTSAICLDWALECCLLKCSIGKKKSRYHELLRVVTIELVIEGLYGVCAQHIATDSKILNRWLRIFDVYTLRNYPAERLKIMVPVGIWVGLI